MNAQLKASVLADIRLNKPSTTIAYFHSITPAQVQQVRQAYRDVLKLRKKGADPRVLYANYRDLLTKQVCGVTE